MSITKEQIAAMSARERDELLENIWEVIDGISPGSYIDEAGEESDDEKNQLHEDMQTYHRDPSSAKTWEAVMLELRSAVNG